MKFPGVKYYPKYSQGPFLSNRILDGTFNNLTIEL